MRYLQNQRCTTYDIVGRIYDVVTYDIQEYHRYNVTYDIVGVTYDVVVTDLRSTRAQSLSKMLRKCENEMFIFQSGSSRLYTGTLKHTHYSSVPLPKT